MSPPPPPYLSPGFDPTKAKVAELRGYLLAHDVQYSSIAKKPQLVALFEQHIRPQAPALVAQMRGVRASADGILDGESAGATSLRELDTDSDADSPPKPKPRSRTRKSLATAAASTATTAAAPTPKHKAQSSAKSKVKARAPPPPPPRRDDSGDEDDDESMDEDPPTPPKKRGRPRKSAKPRSPSPPSPSLSPVAMDVDEYEPAGDSTAPIASDHGSDSDDPSTRRVHARARPSSSSSSQAQAQAASPTKKRKEPSTPRLSELVKQADSPASGSGNFSDFNPFQSGGEETPDRALKRRKSSVGPSRLGKPAGGGGGVGGGGEAAAALAASTRPRKSLPAHLHQHQHHGRADVDQAGSWADSPAKGAKRARASAAAAVEHAHEHEHEYAANVPPMPALPASVRAKHQQRASLGSASASSTPIGVPYMVPVAKVKTTPPQVAEMLRQHEAAQQRASASAPVSASPQSSKPPQLYSSPRTRIAGPSPHAAARPRTASSSSPDDERERTTSVVAAASLRTAKRQVVGQGKQLAADVIRLRDPSSLSSSHEAHEALVALPSARTVRRVTLAALVVAALALVLWRRAETIAAGYCDPTSLSNERVAARRTSLALPSLPDLSEPVGALLDSTGLRPGCTACPQHGHCAHGEFVGCELDHVPVEPGLLRTLGGLVPAPSVCVPDTAKQVAVARQASAGAHVLRHRRGEVVCRSGLEKQRRRDAQGGRGAEDAFVFGMDAVRVLEEMARVNELAREPISDEFVDEINRLALRDLEAHGEVVVWQNGNEYWYASKTADMSLGCRARLFAKNWVKQHKGSLAGLFAALAGVAWVRHKLAQRKRDEVRKEQLVVVALHQLQQQARSHLADPVHVPFAHVAPSHLRDLVLQDEHSPARRAALWHRVAHVVEGNANVRVRDVEIGGEELRGWEWTGPVMGSGGGGGGAGAGVGEVDRPAMVEGGQRVLASLPSSPALARA
ncbi:hypothetical protein JCM3775_002929 [Rhodotorula graminis]|uniref:Man1/Src1 C-terminal domain-containing protein n=1 Tax=Rhodotorula graminis (strain WP1) TaxID=578459 RepID=A0A194S530_RHOGW|nr:uncharacterized protein RHOBADRAFT_52863 [Rhodotorula graminis WP1]KPV75843.1 hypothetical protein RHOBADRAFT_52863 [Rhodotorula graminis WP1]